MGPLLQRGKDAPRCVRQLESMLDEPADLSVCRGGQDSPVKLFDALSGECLHIFKGLDNGTGALSFSPSAQALLAAGGWDAKFVIWDIDVSQLPRAYPADALS